MDSVEEFISYCLSIIGNNVSNSSHIESRYSYLLNMIREGFSRMDVGQTSISANKLYEITIPSATTLQVQKLYLLRNQLLMEVLG